MVVQCFSWALVEFSCNFTQLRLQDFREVRSLWKVLSEQTVGIFIRAAFPGAFRVTKVDIYIGCDGELFVVRHFDTPVPGQ